MNTPKVGKLSLAVLRRLLQRVSMLQLASDAPHVYTHWRLCAWQASVPEYADGHIIRTYAYSGMGWRVRTR